MPHPPVPAPLATQTKSEYVHTYLREGILGGDLTPGQRLSIDAVARDLSVSKIPVREAIQRLCAEGLVVQRTHAGPTVAPVEPHQLEGTYYARLAVEPLAARLAAERIVPGQLGTLSEVQHQMRQALLTLDVPRLGRLNSAFHVGIARASTYQVFVDTVELLLGSVRRYRIVDPKHTSKWESVVDEHEALLSALREGDPDAAEAASLAHVRSQSAGLPGGPVG